MILGQNMHWQIGRMAATDSEVEIFRFGQFRKDAINWHAHSRHPSAPQRRGGRPLHPQRRRGCLRAEDDLPRVRYAEITGWPGELSTEHIGWTGDIAAFAPTAAYLYDVEPFLHDWLRDVDERQSHPGGVVPFVVPDAIKYLGVRSHHGNGDTPTAVWSDAAVWVPWTLWEAYGNRAALDSRFGDWLDLDAPPEAPDQAKADPSVAATAGGYRSARLAADAAAVLGRTSDREEFEALAERMKAAFNEHYVDDGRIRSDFATVSALAIVFGLVDGDDRETGGALLARLVEDARYRHLDRICGNTVRYGRSHHDRPYRCRVPDCCSSARTRPAPTRSRWGRPQSGSAGIRCFRMAAATPVR